MTTKQRRVLRNLFLYLCSIVLLVFVLGPFLWVLSVTLRLETELFVRPPGWVPQNPSLANYLYVLTGEVPAAYAERGLLRSPITQEARMLPAGLRNSFAVAITVTLVNLVLGTIAAYTFAREKFRGKSGAYLFVLGSRLLPPIAVAVPIYMLVNDLGLLDTKLALVLMYSAFTLPLSIWVLTTHFQAMPREIEEAALVDGCTRLHVLRYIVVPLAAPALVAVGAFALLFSYSEFVFALFTTQTVNAKTVPVIISAVANNPDASYTLISVGVMLSIIAPLILAFAFRHFLISGLATSLGR